MRLRRRYLITSLAIAAVVAAACGAIATRMQDRALEYAQVVTVTPIVRPVRTPREVCKSEEVRHERTDRDARADDTYTTTEEHCAMVYQVEEQPQGFEVRYRLNGVEGTVHMNHAPGARIPMRDGRLAPGGPT
jgi:uncharacterized protein YcfJ